MELGSMRRSSRNEASINFGIRTSRLRFHSVLCLASVPILDSSLTAEVCILQQRYRPRYHYCTLGAVNMIIVIVQERSSDRILIPAATRLQLKLFVLLGRN